MRWILMGAGLLFFVWWIRKKHNPINSQTPPPPLKLLRCAHCNVLFPESEAFRSNPSETSSAYCCAAHRDQTENV
jgi:hypothetical protein